MIPLFRRFPHLAGRAAYRPLGTYPTPVCYARSLGLWVKRDDLTHPELGGAKIRKLEFLLPRLTRPALACGPRGSNWLLALQRFRPDVRIYTFPQFYNAFAKENAARLRPARRFPDETLFALGALAEVPRLIGNHLTLVPMGGSDPTTTLGYVNAALEFAGQVERGECPAPDGIFVALGSCGTAAGLALGFALTNLRPTIFAVRITVPPIARLGRLFGLAARCARLMGLKRVPDLRVELVRGYCGGYARPIQAGTDAQRRFADEGLLLDTSYTAKAAAAALAYRPRLRTPLFWHTYTAIGESAQATWHH